MQPLFRIHRWQFLGLICVALCVAISILPHGKARANPWIILDAKTGDLIAQHQANQLWHPASITKLMTAYTVFHEIKSGRIDFATPVRISALALSMPASKMGLPVGTIINIDNALKMILVKSANDVSVALAQSAKGSLGAFLRAMNQHTERLGMTNSRFENPHGLHAINQVTTARDMGLLALAIQNEFPQYSGYFDIPAIRFGKIRMRNHNKMIFNYRGTYGMKTGYTCPSGLNIVARAKRGDKELIAVVLGQHSSLQRNAFAARLLNYGFDDRIRYKKNNHIKDLNPQLTQYSLPKNLTPMVCKPSWSERQMSKKQRRAVRKLYLKQMKNLRDTYLNASVKTSATQKVFFGKSNRRKPVQSQAG